MYSEFTSRVCDSKQGFDFVAAHFACERDKYSADNPNGFVNFGSAQNFLSKPEIAHRLHSFNWSVSDAPYRDFSGTAECREAIAGYLSRTSGQTIQMDDLVVGNGLISLLEALSIAVLDPGDTVLVPTPVFPGLVTALTYRTQASFVPMEIGSESDFQLNPNALQQRLQSEMDQGRNVKAVLLCSPGNPVGQVFTADQIREFVSVAERFGVALIVDEIYASSCFTGVDFFSATSVDSENVFVIGGLSKDFGLAGYATGWIHTRNHRILAALKKQSHYFRLSAPIQTAVVQFLEPQWQTEFSKTNREKLTEGYRYVCDQLSESGVDVVPAQAGLVLWLDMRSFLKSETEQGQFDLYQNLLDEHRVHLSPGAGFHFSDPGYFRICFSQQQETLREGLRRLKQGLQQYQTAQLNRHVEV